MPPAACGKVPAWAQALPFQCSARDCPPNRLAASAHTLLAEEAPAAKTSSSLLLGKGSLVHVEPVRSHAGAPCCPSKAQAVLRPAAVIVVNSANEPPVTCLTTRQDGVLLVVSAVAVVVVAASSAVATRIFASMGQLPYWRRTDTTLLPGLLAACV